MINWFVDWSKEAQAVLVDSDHQELLPVFANKVLIEQVAGVSLFFYIYY